MTRRACIAMALVAVVGLGAHLGRDQIDFPALGTRIEELGVWGALAFAAAFAVGTVLFLPGAPFGLLGGVLFGPLWGTIANLGGATAGATIAFLLARYVASDWVARRAAGRLRHLVTGIETEGWRFVVLARLMPLIPFNLLNYALGLTRIRVVDYVVATLFSMVPGTAAYAWLGHAGRDAIAGNGAAIRYGPAALGVLAAVALLPRLVRRFRGPASTWSEPADLERQRRSSEVPAIIDVRGADEFIGPMGHIPGARNVPVDILMERLDDLTILRDHPVILVCRTDRRSVKAAEILCAAGFRRVTILRGGMEAWNAGRLPTERATSKAEEAASA